jgi:hypothetical protein
VLRKQLLSGHGRVQPKVSYPGCLIYASGEWRRSGCRSPTTRDPSPAPPRRPRRFEKSPPQDIAAEQSVLGGMLLSKDAIADVVEILKAHDFYRRCTHESSTPFSICTGGASRPTA